VRRPLRFLHVTTFYPPYSFGGDGIYVERLARALADDGHLVDVVHCVDAYRLLAGGRARAPARPHPGVGVHPLHGGIGPLSPLLAHQTGHPMFKRRSIEALISSRAFDVIHFHNISLLGPRVLAIAPSDKTAIRLYTAHEYWLICPAHVLWKFNSRPCDREQCLRCVLASRRPPQLWRYTRMLQRSARRVDQFIAPSRFSAEMHRQRGFPASFHVLPLFADEPARPPAKLPHPKPYFLFVGRIEKLKGVDALLSAWSGFDGADLLIVGEGPELGALRARAAGHPRIRFLGGVDHERLDALYAHAIACVIPSLAYETFSLVAVESFAHRTPVIAHRIGALAELVEQCGGGRMYESREELLGAIIELSSRPDLRESLAENGYRAFCERWTPRVHLDRYYELIERTAARKSGATRSESSDSASAQWRAAR